MYKAIRDVLRRELAQKGYEVSVDWEEDARGARDQLARETYDIVVSMADTPFDRKVPAASGQLCGLQLLRELRGSSKQTPFVLLTVSAGQDLSELLKLGLVRLVVEGEEFEPSLLDAVPVAPRVSRGEGNTKAA